MKEYPHISDTRYPDLDTVDVYKIENKFDYARWGVGTQVKLCNVAYNADYKDVVKFADDAARDAYFDELAGRVVTLQTAFQQVPQDAIKIPIPYDSAIRYNYLYIDIPTPTSETQPLDYEQSNRVKRYFFFISEIEQLAPNTSKVSIVLDEWTTYINDVSIPYMMLERGHAPVAMTDTAAYLADPVSNCQYLLAPDVNYGDIGLTTYRNFHPIGAGHKLVCFITTYSYTQLQSFVAGTDLPAGNAATYTDETGRAGYHMQVNGYDFGMGGVDFADASVTPVQAYNVNYQSDVPSYYTYGVDCEDARTFFDYMSRRMPQLMQTLQGCFVIGEDVVNKYDPLNINGVTVYKLQPRTLAFGLRLNKAMFDYPHEWERFAKLYTYPYAQLEVSDNDGRSFTIRIEDVCNTSHLETVLNLASPYLHYQTIALDVAGHGSSQDYIWGRIDGQQVSIDAPFADFAQYMLEWDIPVYALFEREYDDYRLHNFWQMQLAHENAITNYRSAQRIANTTDANAHDTNATNVANTANSGNNAVSNVAVAKAAALTNVTDSNQTGSRIYNSSDTCTQNQQQADVALMQATVETNNDVAAVQNTASQISNGVSAATGAIGNVLSGNIAGAVMSVGSGIANAVTNDMTYNATVQANSTLEQAQEQNMLDKYNASIANAFEAHTYSSNFNTRSTTVSYDASDTQTRNNRTTNNTNANNTANTSNSNADYTRHSQFLSNAAQMTLVQRGLIYDYRNKEFGGQIQRGSYAGDPKLDAQQRRGVTVRVKTQRQSDIAQTAAQFARYGYNLNQIWDMTQGLTLMRNFTYWKAADIWVVDDKGTPNTVQLALQDIFEQGVTVWSDAEKIGRVSVYDN